MPQPRRIFRRILTPPMVVVASLILFVEEWLWVRMNAAMAWAARLPLVRWLERRVAALPAWAAVVCFFLPGLMLMPVKITALFLIGKGHVLTGAGVIILAKVLGTAVVARLFTLCRPALMGVPWFRRAHDGLLRLKEALYSRLRAMPAWQAVQRLKRRLRAWTATLKPGLVARRWKAVAARLRRRAG